LSSWVSISGRFHAPCSSCGPDGRRNVHGKVSEVSGKRRVRLPCAIQQRQSQRAGRRCWRCGVDRCNTPIPHTRSIYCMLKAVLMGRQAQVSFRKPCAGSIRALLHFKFWSICSPCPRFRPHWRRNISGNFLKVLRSASPAAVISEGIKGGRSMRDGSSGGRDCQVRHSWCACSRYICIPGPFWRGGGRECRPARHMHVLAAIS